MEPYVKKKKKENLAHVFALLPSLISVKSGSCGRVKNYLWERGIQLSDDGKGKKKAELFDLCKKAAAIKQIKLASVCQRPQKAVGGEILTNGDKFSMKKLVFRPRLFSLVA